MSTHKHSSYEHQTHKLGSGEVEDPFLVVSDFFDYSHLSDARNQLWEWLKSTVTGTYHRETLNERVNLIDFYERLEKLIEAIYIIHQQKKVKRNG